jgi:hypothetical protein
MQTVTILAHYITDCSFALDDLSECIQHVRQSASNMDKNEIFFPFILENGMMHAALASLMKNIA